MKNDIVVVLQEDHRLLENMRRGLRTPASAEAENLLAEQFSTALGGHLVAMRRVVYPALKAMEWKNVTSSLLVQHATLGRMLAELLTLPQGSVLFSEHLRGLVDATPSSISLERGQLLPLLADRLDSAQRMDMGVDALGYLPHLSDAAPLDSRFPASQWIEEARLVLGSLGYSTV